LTGTTAAFNSGAANVVASFTSTDTIGAIQLVDNGGNVEIGAVGNDFHVMNAGGVAKMVVENSGKVGIGNTSPSHMLHVNAADGASDNTQAMTIENNEATDGRSYGLKIKAGSTANDASLFVQDHDAANDHFIIRGNGNVGIGTTAPAKGKLQIDGGSSGSGDFDALAIKHVNTTTTNDGPVMRFEGSYNSNDWALAEMKAVNGGAGHGTDFQIKLHPGDGTQGSAVLPAFNLKRTVSNQLQMDVHAGGATTYADEASYTINGIANTSCLISIQSQRKAGGNSVSYDAGLFFAHYGIDSGVSVVELADPGGTFIGTDTDGMVCVFKGNNSPNVTIKNRLGYSTGLSIQVIRFLGN
jgi:hypothetical protein